MNKKWDNYSMDSVFYLNRHRILIGMAAIGQRNIDIAKKTGMSASTVCRVLRKPAIIKAIDNIQEKVFKAMWAAKMRPRPEAISLFENLAEEMDNPAASDESRLNAMKKMMDLVYGEIS